MQRKTLSDTAILYFTRNQREEAMHKPLGGKNRKISEQISNKLFHKTLGVIKSSGLPYYIIDDSLQKGSSFGEKFSNAFSDIFNLGFENVISIGNDCAQLSKSDLQLAADQLNFNDVVTGPDFRGGYYLIGFKKAAFCEIPFTLLHWCTPELADNLTQYCTSAHLRMFALSAKQDMNRKEDILIMLHAKNIESAFQKIIASLIGSLDIVYYTYTILFISALVPEHMSLKDPPLMHI